MVKDILAEVFGFDKYTELTSEQQIKGTFCDLAIKIEGKIRYLIEVKAIGIELNNTHLRQALNYGAQQGIEWVILTNSVEWQIYRVIFEQPISHEEVLRFSLLDLSASNEEDQERLFLLAREGIASDAISSYFQRSQLLNRFTISSVVLTDPILSAIRRELRRLFPDLKVDVEQISQLLENEVLKREVLEGEKAKEAAARIGKKSNRLQKVSSKGTNSDKQVDG